jgi:Tfp pilus assembly protein PilX|tara:strand:+ start:781 stop:1410 length:630 start_codon:yes stop_codon:yes gene_type:complete
MKKNLRKNEKGFALPLALFLLVVMSLMGSILISRTTTEHKANITKDTSQQAFYAAESGITDAKKWMVANSDTLKTSSPNSIDGNLRFCKTSMFPNIISGSKGFKTERKSLNEVITNTSSDELKKFQKFSYEYFITYSPDVNGITNTARKTTAASSEGTSVTQGTSYKQSGTALATYYTIYSCGCSDSKNKCDKDSDTLVRLEQVVTLVH